MDQIFHTNLKEEGRTRRYCEVCYHIAATRYKSHDPKHQRTKAEREAHWGGSKIVHVDKNRTCRCSTKEPRKLLGLSMNPGTFSRRETTPKRKRNKGDFGSNTRMIKTKTIEDCKECVIRQVHLPVPSESGSTEAGMNEANEPASTRI